MAIAEDPGRQLGLAAEVRQPAVDPQEHLLREVLHARTIRRASRHQREHEIPVPIHELAKGPLVTPLASRDQLGFDLVGHSRTHLERRTLEIVSRVDETIARNTLVSSSHEPEWPTAMTDIWETIVLVLVAVLPIMVVGGGITIVLLAMWRQAKMQEMRHRERVAMIERGLMPPPERDPATFHAMSRHYRPPTRFLSFGIALVAIGFGLMLVIAFAGGAPGLPWASAERLPSSAPRSSSVV
jgi:hypothetical protein